MLDYSEDIKKAHIFINKCKALNNKDYNLLYNSLEICETHKIQAPHVVLHMVSKLKYFEPKELKIPPFVHEIGGIRKINHTLRKNTFDFEEDTFEELTYHDELETTEQFNYKSKIEKLIIPRSVKYITPLELHEYTNLKEIQISSEQQRKELQNALNYRVSKNAKIILKPS